MAHFVPVKRQSDGVVGVYDRVAGKFYENGNASGSPFTAGSAEITNSSSGAPAELRLDVPEGSDQYQKLEYIEATGKEYILTDYQPNGTDRVEMKVNFTSTEENQCLFCTRKTQNSRSFSLFYIKNQGGVDYEKFRFDYANKQFFGNSVTPNVDVEISIDGDTRENNIGLGEPFATALTPGPPFPILLFGAFYEGSGTNALAKAKCYYFKVYDNAGNLKLDMVPARSLDGTMPYGMYDKVAGKFYPSSSKTAFTVHGAAKAGNYLLDNTTVSFTGNMKVVKKGGGIYIASMPDQTYTGGTVVEEGLLKCGAHGSVNPFGADGSAVTVSTNGILDVNGKESFGNYSFILDGGTLGNSFDRTGMYSVNCIQSLSLAADSAINLDGKYTLGGATASTLDLHGNKLTIRTPCAIYFRGVEAISSGTIELHGPRIIEFAYQNTADTNDLRLVDLIVKDGGQLRVQTNVVAKLGGYVSAAAASDNNASYSGKLELYGTFKPDTDYFHGLELQDGATIDLSGRTTPLPLQSLIGANCHPNAKNVTFADNATILVSCGARTIPTSVPLISWTAETKPANLNTLQFVFEKDARRTKLIKMADGVYQPKGFAIYLK